MSGHYPPNFVSGGSLQPQRLAQGLRARGHDVRVYAGRLDDTRAPLEAWDETDETGMPVRWIVTTPWDDWSDDRNWHCPDVERDFATYLATVQPDVVHLHDLQMLGGGLVPAAKAAGAKVVVTMHDFWWICARLFLVDRRLRPCSLVVDAGTCRCEVDRKWLLRRDGKMRHWLDAADVVFAVSESAARVLAANGIAVDRLDVDENGLPDEDVDATRPTTHRPEGPVHFVYAGGKHAVKGAGIVLKAMDELRDRTDWRLTTYGLTDKEIEGSGVDTAGLPLTMAPSFSPDERDEVFAAADVVLVPSIMRETHSILTREALGRGVPVLCTNTLGPEEVVRHGENGLVVPAGDADAMADAMRSLVEDRALLQRLTDGARAPVAIRTLTDQIDGLERRYTKLVAPTAVPTPRTKPRAIERVLWAVGIEGAPLRYRARLAAEAIAMEGVKTDARYYRHPVLLDLVEDADVLYVYRVPATHQALQLIARARERGIPVIFDVDDLIFDPDVAPEIPALQLLPPQEAEGWLYGVHRYRTTMEYCDGYVGSTPQLVRHAAQVTGLPAAQFDNGVGVLLGQASDKAVLRPRAPGRLRVGYLSGTITHDRDWFFVEPAIAAVLEAHPDVELWMVGHLPDTPLLERFPDQIHRVPFQPWLRLPRLLRDLDVNLAPLEPGSRFNESKSAIKWLEAALVATPTVASSTEPFRDAVEHGVSGLLATTADEWTAAVTQLVEDASTRRLMGERARREALVRWSPHLQRERFLAVLDRAREWPAAAAARPDVGWTDAIADEPWEPMPLEPYTASAAGRLEAKLEFQREKAEWFARRAKTAVRERGVVATTRAGGGRAVRAAVSAPRRATASVRGIRAPSGNGIVRRALAPIRRLWASFRKHGVLGTIGLAVPLVRHAFLHGWTVVRLRLQHLRERLLRR